MVEESIVLIGYIYVQNYNWCSYRYAKIGGFGVKMMTISGSTLRVYLKLVRRVESLRAERGFIRRDRIKQEYRHFAPSIGCIISFSCMRMTTVVAL
jgi:hypothetical protein